MRFTRNRGSKRLRARRGNGRFARSTLANTFGFRAVVCDGCRGLNPHGISESAPTECRHCGAELTGASEIQEGE